MAYFTTGKATLNEHLVILNGDKNFFHYIAWENSMYLEQSVFPVDYPEVKKICEQVMETGERMLVSYRVYRPDETKHWVIASVERKELSGENVICFNIQAIDDLEQEISEMHDTLNERNTYMDILDECLRTLIEKGKGIEVNTAGFKYGLGHPNPHEAILKRYRELGGELVTIGSDAHDTSAIASDYDKAMEALEYAGFKYYCMYMNRIAEFKKIV